MNMILAKLDICESHSQSASTIQQSSFVEHATPKETFPVCRCIVLPLQGAGDTIVEIGIRQ